MRTPLPVYIYIVVWVVSCVFSVSCFRNIFSHRLSRHSVVLDASVAGLDNDLLGRDYLGMLNFCLRRSDSALSGQSRSKVLNAFTNEIFKSVMIGYQPRINDLISQMEMYKSQIKATDCFLGEEDGVIGTNEVEKNKACDRDLIQAIQYVDSLERLVVKGEVSNTAGTGIYSRGYNRLVTQLRDVGCSFLPSGVKPIDSEICLSIMDSFKDPSLRTKTRELNRIANWVPRAVIYGETTDRLALAEAIEHLMQSFSDEWLDGKSQAQEMVFLQALTLLLREGVAAAEAAITYTENSSDKFGESNISGYLTEVMTMVEPPLRLFDPYLNTFQRIVTVCLRDLGARCWTVPQDEEVLGTFSLWEQSLRRNFTSNSWDENPAQLTGGWTMLDIGGDSEFSGDNTYMSMTASEEEVARARFLGQRSSRGAEPSVEVEVEFCADGSLRLTPPRGSGHQWRFRPGPAHLDTCEFTIRSNTEPDLVLQYVGYIDRGQRTECSFSGRPIRMAGRVQSVVRGILRGSTRFVMLQKK